MIRTLVVDDEPMARGKLRRLLSQEPDFTVVGVADNPRDARELISALRPDLVFLDIVMPGGDGFDALDGLDPTELPRVVFVTAFDTHAVRAFDVHAVDYLLKPFDRRRFGRAVAKVRASIETAEVQARLARVLGQRREQRPPADRLLVRDGERIVLVPFRSIDRIESSGNYLTIFAGSRTYQVRDTMKRLSARLPDERFLRIHRSHLVNVDRIESIHPLFRGDAEIQLVDGMRLPLSRHYRGALTRFQP